MQGKKKQKIEKVTKPYLRGRIVDRTLPGGALKFFFFTALMTFVYFMSLIVASVESRFLSVVINLAILATTWLIFWQSGLASGADAVNQGEIMYQRREKGRPVADWEEKMCYHPLKGLVIALVGSLPLFICSVVLACIAQRQMTPIGMVPGWVDALEGRQEIGGALAYYHQEAKLTLEIVLRVIIHMSTMPYVSLLGADNKDMMLLLQRISPILNLIPAIVYGAAYAMGPRARAVVHTNIALGKKKAKKKQAKERRARLKSRSSGPQQLN